MRHFINGRSKPRENRHLDNFHTILSVLLTEIFPNNLGLRLSGLLGSNCVQKTEKSSINPTLAPPGNENFLLMKMHHQMFLLISSELKMYLSPKNEPDLQQFYLFSYHYLVSVFTWNLKNQLKYVFRRKESSPESSPNHFKILWLHSSVLTPC